MSETDLTTKARRAAEWAKKTMPYISAQETIHGVWNVYEMEPSGVGERLIWGQLSPGMLIGFAEDRGWQDAEADDGVEWVTTITDQAEMSSPVPETYGTLELTVTQRNNQWSWEVTEIGIVPVASGTAPTRAEARRQAIDAAMGMGNQDKMEEEK